MFPDSTATASLDLCRPAPPHVDLFESYALFAGGGEVVEAVFECVLQGAFATPKDARMAGGGTDRVGRRVDRWKSQ